MKRYPAYQAYKTQFYRLEIPKHWNWSYGNACFYENTDKYIPHTRPTLLRFQYGMIVPKSVQDVWDGDITVYEKYTAVKPKTIMLNGLNLNYDFVSQRVAEVVQSGIITSAYISMRCRASYDVRYAVYLLKTIDAQKIFHGMGTGIRLTLSFADIKKMQFPVPPLAEQRQIVRYLDARTAQIDRAIRGYERLLALLEERRIAAIVSCTEQGMVSKVVKRRSSLAWVGEYPAHWRETKLKHILRRLNRTCTPTDELLICTHKGKVVYRGDSKVGFLTDNDDIYQGVKRGDLLIHGMEAWNGAIAISSFDGKCAPVVHVCDSHENKWYIAYYLKALAYKNVFKKLSNGIRERTSDFRSWDKLGELVIVLPPMAEQNGIVSYLQAQEEKITFLAKKVQREIDLLRERRTRLIADVVTGQIDVRDAVVPAAADGEVLTDGDEHDGAGA